MSEPVARQRPMIDLDEFERRLRRPAAAQPPRNEDPLAELARLVGNGNDPYQGMFQERPQAPARMAAAERIAPRAEALGRGERLPRPDRPGDRPRLTPDVVPIPTRGNAPRPGADSWPEPVETWSATRVAPPQNGTPNVKGRSQALGGSFAAIEAGLRGSIQPDFELHAPEPAVQPNFQPGVPHYAAPASEGDDEDWLSEAQMAAAGHPVELAPEPPRSRRLLYVTAAIILVGVAGIGATFALKRSVPSPRQIAMIKAATTPDKVAPPAQSAGDGAKIIQDASVLDKTPQPMPIKVVNRTEQPVDVAQTVASAQKPGGPQGAASVPVPPPPTQQTAAGNGGVSLSQPWQQGSPDPKAVASAAPDQGFGGGAMIEARKVKTVSVRPDGTIISDDSPAAPPPAVASAGGDAKDMNRADPNAARATPAERQALVADRGGPPAAADRTAKPAESAKPARVASLEAPNSDDVAASGSHGSFAVQLAAPATEKEALQAITRLKRRYAGELGRHALKWHHAKVGGKSVYRIRVGGLSKENAVTLCQALQAKGGSCFVAKD